MSGLSRSGLNAGYNQELQNRLQIALCPLVEKALQSVWGNRWLAELNSRRTSQGGLSGGPKSIDIVNGKVKWDTNGLLQTIRDHHGLMSNIRRKDAPYLTGWCSEMLTLRNAPAHANTETYHKVNSDRKIGHQTELTINLMKAFHADKEAAEIETLMDDFWSPNRVEISKVNLETKPSEPSPSPPAVVLKALPQDRSFFAIPEPIQSRRRTPLPPPGRGVIVFPLAGHGDTPREDECLASATGTVLQGVSDGKFSLATGLSGNEETFYQIVKDVRHNEHDSAKLLEKTRIRFDARFMGDSFGLAVAIADRTARYGLSNDFEGRRVVATGTVIPHHGGDIGAIDALLSKITIVQQFTPARSLFVFPSRNLEKKDPLVLDALANLKSSGRDWRAVGHIDELNDLLANFNVADAVIETVKPLAPESQIAAVPIKLLPKVEVPPLPVNQRSDILTKAGRRIVGVSLGAILALAALYLFAVWNDQRKQDIAAVQASDERLQALVSAAFNVQSGSEQAGDCNRLVIASKAISNFDMMRLGGDDRHAIDRAKECRSLIAQSDNRLSAMVSASKAADNDLPTSVVRLAEKRGALTSFDISRNDRQDVQAAIAAGNKAISEVKDSDDRIATFNRSLASWNDNADNGKAAEAAAASYRQLNDLDLKRPDLAAASNTAPAKHLLSLLSDSDDRINEAIVFVSAMERTNTPQSQQEAEVRLAKLTALDMSRLSPPQATAIEQGRQIPRAARWAEFQNAASAYRTGATPATTVQLANAFAALTPPDRVAMAPVLGGYRNVIGEAQRSLLESDVRLTRLQSVYTVLANADKRQSASGVPYQQLVDAVTDLTDLDRSRLSDQQRIAIDRASNIRTELANSDKRIQSAQAWSEIVMKSKTAGTVPGTILKNARDAFALLTDLDKQRMTDDQKHAVQAVCGVPMQVTAGMLPAIAKFDCYQPGDFKPRALPAIRQ